MATKEQEAIDNAQEALSGVGLEDFTADTLAASYLSMVQPDSSASTNHAPGTWRSTASDTNYGNVVRVIPMAFKVVWTERDKTTFMTVGRYQPHSIEVKTTYPKPGQRGFPTMINPATENKVEELYIYACLLADDLDAGIQYFSPTPKSMGTCKKWNKLISTARTSDGLPANIFSFKWDLQLDLIPNPANANKKICVFSKVTCAGEVEKDTRDKVIVPQLIAARNVQMLVAPEQSGDVQE